MRSIRLLFILLGVCALSSTTPPSRTYNVRLSAFQVSGMNDHRTIAVKLNKFEVTGVRP